MYIHTYSILLCLPQKQQISEEPQLCIGIRAVYKEKSETRFKKKKKKPNQERYWSRVFLLQMIMVNQRVLLDFCLVQNG